MRGVFKYRLSDVSHPLQNNSQPTGVKSNTKNGGEHSHEMEEFAYHEAIRIYKRSRSMRSNYRASGVSYLFLFNFELPLVFHFH